MILYIPEAHVDNLATDKVELKRRETKLKLH